MFHIGAPFDAEVKSQLGLGVENCAGASSLGGRETVHGLKRSTEGFGGPVAVANGYIQNRLTRDDFCSGCRHSPSSAVLRDGKARQRREHPPKVILRSHRRSCEAAHADRLRQILLNEPNRSVPSLHGYLHPCQSRYGASTTVDPTIHARNHLSLERPKSMNPCGVFFSDAPRALISTIRVAPLSDADRVDVV